MTSNEAPVSPQGQDRDPDGDGGWIPPWQRPRQSWRERLRWRNMRVWLIGLLLIVLLGGIYMGLREMALRSADHLQVTVTQTFGGPYQVVYQHTFGRTMATDAEHMLNDETTLAWDPSLLPILAPFVGTSSFNVGTVLTGNHPIWKYQLTFFWHGLVVESTSTDDSQLPEYFSISSLGLADLHTHRTVNNGFQVYSLVQRLAADSGGAIPTSPGYGRS